MADQAFTFKKIYVKTVKIKKYQEEHLELRKCKKKLLNLEN